MILSFFILEITLYCQLEILYYIFMLNLLSDKQMRPVVFFAKVTTSLANFHIFTDISTCIWDTIIMNEML